MATFGHSVTWHDRDGCITQVFVAGLSSPELALLEAVKSALQAGWTEPKWYQWWRWQETRLSPEIVELAQRELKLNA